MAQESIEKEVNEQVWKVFTESWTNYDAITFNSIHTDDIFRASSGGLTIGQEYKDQNTRMFENGLQSGRKKTIQFSFEQRNYKGDLGYEVGYYKINVKRTDGTTSTFYSRFHVRLKKVNGQWKIAQDWDTNSINGEPITEDHWKSAEILSF
jgi:ketosteroid isomerase-like protein